MFWHTRTRTNYYVEGGAPTCAPRRFSCTHAPTTPHWALPLSTLPFHPQNFDGHIAGPAIYQFQQVEARGAIFWEPLVLAIGLCEAWRVAIGWEVPTGTGFNSLKGERRAGGGAP